jgi:hypothetical protein
MKPRFIVCAANRNTKTGQIVCGARHYDAIMRSIIFSLPDKDDWRGAEQGFIDQFGLFMTREEALELALENGQKRYDCGGDHRQLFSENLY